MAQVNDKVVALYKDGKVEGTLVKVGPLDQARVLVSAMTNKQGITYQVPAGVEVSVIHKYCTKV